MARYTFVLAWWAARSLRWARFEVESPGVSFTAERIESGSLGGLRKAEPADVVRALVAERVAVKGVTRECVSIVGRGKVPHG
jgi:hypothetical protein